jgi:RNA-binding protein YlmH
MAHNFFIDNMVERVAKGEETLFLNTSELNIVCSILNKNKISYSIYYPYKMAEKVIIYSEKIPDIMLLEIISKHSLKHQDILGSLFANKISPNQYGDILIINNHYYLIILSTLAKYFLTSFNRIGKYDIEIIQCDLNIIADFEYQYETLNFLTSSLRIDNIVSAITGLSRSKVDELFKDKDILLRYELCKCSKAISEGDIISIRKYGKYKLNSIISRNAKGKLKIEILKYK